MIDNCLLPITKNDYEILRKFVSIGRTNFFWIDAICIDQKDDGDNNQQTQLMREIYRTASRVIV